MSRREKKDAGGADANAWMVTFSDLLMLMLTFFVLLLTMSSLDSQKIKEALHAGLHIQSAPQRAARVLLIEPMAQKHGTVEMAAEKISALLEADNDPGGRVVDELASAIEDVLALHDVSAKFAVERRPEGLVVDLDASVVFEPGAHSLSEDARPLVRDLTRLVNAVDSNVAVEAHGPPARATGDDTGKTSAAVHLEAADKAWELSLRRADTIAAFMLRRGADPGRLQIAGSAEIVISKIHESADSENPTPDVLRLVLFAGPKNALETEQKGGQHGR